MKKLLFFLVLFISGFSLKANADGYFPSAGAQGDTVSISFYSTDLWTFRDGDNFTFQGDSFSFYSGYGTMYDSGRDLEVTVIIPVNAPEGYYSIIPSGSGNFSDFFVTSALIPDKEHINAGTNSKITITDIRKNFTGSSLTVWLTQDTVTIIADSISIIGINTITCYFKVPDHIPNGYYNLHAFDPLSLSDNSLLNLNAIIISNIHRIIPDTIKPGFNYNILITSKPGTFKPSDTIIKFYFTDNNYSFDNYIYDSILPKKVLFRSSDTLIASIYVPEMGNWGNIVLSVSNRTTDSFSLPDYFYITYPDWTMSYNIITQGQRRMENINFTSNNSHFDKPANHAGLKLSFSFEKLDTIHPVWTHVFSGSDIITDIHISSNAPIGYYDIDFVDSIDGNLSRLGALKVVKSNITSVNPDTGIIGDSVAVSIADSNFLKYYQSAGIIVGLGKDGHVLQNTACNSYDKHKVYPTFYLPKNSAPGMYDMWLTYYGDSDFLANAFYFKPANLLTGYIYEDKNHNGQCDSGEDGVSGVNIIVNPGNIQTITDNNGKFILSLIKGNYSVIAQLPEFADSIVPNLQNVKFLKSTGYDSINFATEYPNRNIYDAQADLAAPGWARAYEEVNFGITAKNAGTGTIHATIKFLRPHDFDYDFESGDFNKLHTTSGDTFVWDNVVIGPRQTFNEFVFCQAIPTTWGRKVKAEVWIIIKEHDSIPTNNHDSALIALVASHDPNSKSVSPADFIPTTPMELRYTVNFQNTGTDTAFKVVIMDTLSPSLDLTTFRFISSSHKCHYTLENNLLTFTFDSIILPDSITNSALSIGYIKYGIYQKKGLTENSTISNTAYIYFDYNDAVITKPTIITVNNDSFYKIYRSESAINPDSNKNDSNQKISCFPNPTHDAITLTASKSYITGITMTDMTGREIYKQENLYSTSVAIQTINMWNGMYILKVKVGNSIYITKFVKE